LEGGERHEKAGKSLTGGAGPVKEMPHTVCWEKKKECGEKVAGRKIQLNRTYWTTSFRSQESKGRPRLGWGKKEESYD